MRRAALRRRKLFGPSLFATGEVYLGQRFARALVDIGAAQPERDVAKNALPRQLRELSNRWDYFPGDLLAAGRTANDIFTQHIPRKT
jgi:hypothetical protein